MTKRQRRQAARDRADRQLANLYARVPDVGCRGLCYDQCSGIDASQLERDRLAARGFPLPNENAHEIKRRFDATGVKPRCPALTDDNRCGAYTDRPLICRVWGAADGLPCPHGCVPEGGRYMTHADFQPLVRGVERVSRAATGVQRAPLPEDKPGQWR